MAVFALAAGGLAGYIMGTQHGSPASNPGGGAPIVTPTLPPADPKASKLKANRLDLTDPAGTTVLTMYEQGGKAYLVVKDGSRFQTIDLAAAARALR